MHQLCMYHHNADKPHRRNYGRNLGIDDQQWPETVVTISGLARRLMMRSDLTNDSRVCKSRSSQFLYNFFCFILRYSGEKAAGGLRVEEKPENWVEGDFFEVCDRLAAAIVLCDQKK